MKQVMRRFLWVSVCAVALIPNVPAFAEEESDQPAEVEKARTEIQALKSVIKSQGETITRIKKENEDLAKEVQELRTALDRTKAQTRAWKTVKPDSHEWRQLFAWEGGMGETKHNFVIPDTVKDWRVRWRSKPKIEGASRTFGVYIRRLLGEPPPPNPLVAKSEAREQKEYEERVFYCEGLGDYELKVKGMGAQQWEVVVEGRVEKPDGDGSGDKFREVTDAAEADKLGIWDGFRGIKWGTELATVPGMKVENRPTPYQTNYERPTDKKTIGNAKLQKIRYSAIRGKLGMVWLLTKGLENNIELVAALSTVFGKASDESDNINTWIWHGQTTSDEDVTIRVTYLDEDAETIVLTMYEPLMKEADEEEAKKLKKDF